MGYWLKIILTCSTSKYNISCCNHIIVLLVISTKSNTIQGRAKQNFEPMIKSFEAAVQNLTFNLKIMEAWWKSISVWRVESSGAFYLTWWICFPLFSYFNKFNSWKHNENRKISYIQDAWTFGDLDLKSSCLSKSFNKM